MRIHDLPLPSSWSRRSFEPQPRSPSNSALEAEVQALFQRQFGALAAARQRFHEVMRSSFGNGYDVRKAERYRQLALAGDFGWLPPLRWVDPVILEGARSAYYAEFGTVFLDRALQRFPALAAATFAEAAGCVLDALLSPEDAPDHRGELFRRFLGSEGLA
ncbi:hypothetical protein [Hyalangium sp.]|uniref:hypothetical protein n=1 Tax=Hyalangium sp. TaxID=2028555 RepID=UPI002D55918B|nr:hypothetical protein [Hyalangium sp.]HYI02962.1 hypothetical protein [Hyalangium sp.]